VQAARARLENLQQIPLHVLEHQIQLTLAPERFLRVFGCVDRGGARL
jgi:hypothetical protein